MSIRIEERLLKQVERAVLNGSYLNRNLDRGGKIVIDKMTPVLTVYRFSGDKPDKYFENLVKTQTAFLIAHEDQDLGPLLHIICEAQSERFNSFLIMELWEGKSEDFHIYGPTSKVQNTINTLKEGLMPLTEGKYGITITDTFTRNPPAYDPLLSIDETHKLGVLVIGLEIPLVYGDAETTEVYHLKYRRFQSAFSEALKKTAFNFSRLQTNAGFDHYWRLGKSQIDNTVRSVDAQLADLSQRIDLLMRVTPVNEYDEWVEFRDNDFGVRPNFSYRLITIDPEYEKRRLFNIPVDGIDDPTLAHIYREKRNALEKELIMLEERETDRFMSMSENLIGPIRKETIAQATHILEETADYRPDPDIPTVGCRDFYPLASKEMAHYRKAFDDDQLQVQVRDDITGLMVSRGRLFIGEKMDLPVIQQEAMLQHEVGTHVLTYCNGKRQPMKLLSRGFANYDELQEGLAVFMEYLAGGLPVWRMRLLAARVIGVQAMLGGADFIQTFRLLHDEHHFEPGNAFNITGRIFRGGGYTKDAVYLQGLLGLMDYLENEGNIHLLFAGKFALTHVKFINELIHRGIISQPVLPKLLESEEVKKKIEHVRNGAGPLDLIENYHEDSIHS